MYPISYLTIASSVFFLLGAYGSLPDAAIRWCLWTGGGGVLTRDSIWPDQRRTDLMAVSLSFEIGGHRRDTIFLWEYYDFFRHWVHWLHIGSKKHLPKINAATQKMMPCFASGQRNTCQKRWCLYLLQWSDTLCCVIVAESMNGCLS